MHTCFTTFSLFCLIFGHPFFQSFRAFGASASAPYLAVLPTQSGLASPFLDSLQALPGAQQTFMQALVPAKKLTAKVLAAEADTLYAEINHIESQVLEAIKSENIAGQEQNLQALAELNEKLFKSHGDFSRVETFLFLKGIVREEIFPFQELLFRKGAYEFPERFKKITKLEWAQKLLNASELNKHFPQTEVRIGVSEGEIAICDLQVNGVKLSGATTKVLAGEAVFLSLVCADGRYEFSIHKPELSERFVDIHPNLQWLAASEKATIYQKEIRKAGFQGLLALQPLNNSSLKISVFNELSSSSKVYKLENQEDKNIALNQVSDTMNGLEEVAISQPTRLFLVGNFMNPLAGTLKNKYARGQGFKNGFVGMGLKLRSEKFEFFLTGGEVDLYSSQVREFWSTQWLHGGFDYLLPVYSSRPIGEFSLFLGSSYFYLNSPSYQKELAQFGGISVDVGLDLRRRLFDKYSANFSMKRTVPLSRQGAHLLKFDFGIGLAF